MLQTLVKSAFKSVGIEIKRLLPASNFGLQIARIIVEGNYDLVFDIGANVGMFAIDLRSHGYKGTIVSVEPLTMAHARLSDAARNDPEWHVAPRGALGAAPGATTINISGMNASSSLLPMNDTHERAAPGSARVGGEQVGISTLDALFDEYGGNARKVFVKIDTQGFELEVLKGALKSLPRIDALLLELSLVELYSGQPLWTSVIDWLHDHNFDLVVLSQAFVDPKTFHTLQVDGMFRLRSTA